MSRLLTGHLLLVTCYLLLQDRSLVTGHRSAVTDTTRTTRSGVFSPAQATRGKEIYQLNCVSCHTPASHTGEVFAAKWQGKPLWELYRYITEAMPKSEPGSLTERQYTLVTAYLLKLNGMPSGDAELTADSIALKQIRIELKADSAQTR